MCVELITGHEVGLLENTCAFPHLIKCLQVFIVQLSNVVM